MPPIIHCVRHAQGFHNLGAEFFTLPDPRLTPLGEEQCAKLQEEHFKDQSKISLVTASPLSRTLHTAALTFKPALSNGKAPSKILAIPDAQETSDYPCDTGSDPDVLRTIVAEHGWAVDLSLVRDGWNVKTLSNRYSPASDAIKARAAAARRLLRQKARELTQNGDENAQIVLVTHGGYLHYFTNDWESSSISTGTGWANTETRSYTFAEDFTSDADSEALLTETMDSRRKRGKEQPMAGPEKQQELFEKAMQAWEDDGLQNPSKLGLPGQESAAKNQHVVDGSSGRDVEVVA